MTNSVDYYALMPSTDLADVGYWPQIDEMKGLSPSDVEAFDRLITLLNLPEELPRTQGFVLNPDAKSTDLLSNKFIRDPMGLTISTQLKSLLDSFELENTVSSAMEIQTMKGLEQRHTLFIGPSPHLLELSRSVYVEADMIGEDLGPEHRFASVEELTTKARDLLVTVQRRIVPQSIVFTREVDLLRIPRSHNVLISKRLKEEIEAQGISGIWIGEQDIEYSME